MVATLSKLLVRALATLPGQAENERELARQVAIKFLDVPSDQLAHVLLVPARTIRHWRAAHLEDRRAERNDMIWKLHQRGIAVGEIAAVVGLSLRWTYEIIRQRRRGHWMAHRRFF